MGERSDGQKSGRNEKGKFLQTDCNMTPQRRGNDSMERHGQTTRGERARRRENERGFTKLLEIWTVLQVSTS